MAGRHGRGPDRAWLLPASLAGRLIAALFATLFATSAATAMTSLDDDALREVWGQALVKVEKFQGNGGALGDADKTFTRISLDIEAEILANIDLIELGNYPIPCDTHGPGAVNDACLDQDILFRNVSLGCVEGSGCPETFKLEGPYIEFAYRNDGNSNRRLSGLRIGFDRIDGVLGGEIMAISGDLQGRGEIFGLGVGNGEIHEPRENKLHLYGLGFLDLGEWDLTLAKRLYIENSRNFYVGFQRENVNYPKIGAGPQAVAKPGFWINLQDGVTLDLFDILFQSRVDNCWGGDGSTPCYR